MALPWLSVLLQGHVPFPSNQNDTEIVMGVGERAAQRSCDQRYQKNLSRQVNLVTSAE